MREILFRGKRANNGEWVEGTLLINKRYSTDIDHYLIFPTGAIYGYDDFELMMWEVEPETVGQYTGLTDKNGKKIFEGDIISDEEIGLLGTVVYATPQDGFDGFAGFMVNDVIDGLQNYNGFWHLTEVIGNIHDNPELIGGADNEM